MVKKKQPDFQKTKLKPGKTLPRGRNITNTAFKSKKIVMRSRTIKIKSELTIEECLKDSCHKTNPVKSRKERLNQLRDLLLKNEDTVCLYLNDIISSMKGMLFESDEDLNNGAVKILEICLSLNDDMKISSYFPYLMKLLACAMTSSEPKIKGMALRLLDVYLKTHPKLTCQSLIVLKYLQNLLSGPSYNTKSRKRVQNTNLLIGSGHTFYSQDWRFQVLAHMNMFLVALLNSFKEDEVNDNSEKEVYWNFEDGPVYLELYAGGGLKPIDIEKFDLCSYKTDEFDLDDPEKVFEFVSDFMDILAQIFIEEIADGTSKADDDLVMSEAIKNLNIMFQLLCYLGEWVTVVSNFNYDFPIDMEMSFSKDLYDKIFKNISKFPFVPRGSVFETKPNQHQKHLPCIHLNLAICYLYYSYIMKPGVASGSDNFRQQALSYVQSVMKMPYEIKYDSIPILLKLMKILLQLSKFAEVLKIGELDNIFNEMIKLIRVNVRPNHKHLISFFIDLSLEVSSEYLEYEKRPYMENWFSRMLALIENMVEMNITDKEFLKSVRLIAIRKHPYFILNLEKIKISTIKGMLLHEDDDMKETAMYLVYNMENISWPLLQEITNVILGENNFSLKKSLAFIRLLMHKYTEQDVNAENRINFIAFLINIMIDSINLDNTKWINYNLPNFKDAWNPCCKIAPYTILPSLHWKEHSKLFEVCYMCLNKLPSLTVNKVTMNIFNELMGDDRTNFPIHSVIAMLKLNNPGMEEKYYYCRMQDLIYSSIFFVSVFTSLKDITDEWYEGNVTHLMNSLTINRSTALQLIKYMEFDSSISKEGIVVYYMLRILKFLTSSQLILVEDSERILNLFEDLKKLICNQFWMCCLASNYISQLQRATIVLPSNSLTKENNCLDRNIDRQPLFISLFTAFNYQYSGKHF